MKKILFLLMILNSSILSAQQQDSSLFRLSSYSQNIATFNKQNPQEKVYLHFDNSYYHAGETVWFKAYVVSTNRLRIIDYSKVLYIDLVSPEGKLLETVKLKIEKGQCHGNIVLRDTLFPGYYEVRAYTQAMLNFGAIVHTNSNPNFGFDKSINNNLNIESSSQNQDNANQDITGADRFEVNQDNNNSENKEIDFGGDNKDFGGIMDLTFDRGFSLWDTLPYLNDFYAQRNMREYGSVFSRVFPVYNKLSKSGDYFRDMKTRPSLYIPEKIRSNLVLRFYPEGGHLVSSHPSVIAFEARNERGQLVDIEGRLIKRSGEELASFKTTHGGRGMFYLQMDSTSWIKNKNQLKAEVEYKGKKYTFPLSPSLEQGYAMRVNNLAKNVLQISLQKSPNYDSKLVGVTIQSGGQLYYSRMIPTSTRTEFNLTITKTSLPTGVNQITLFDVKGAVLAERLIFINHGEYARNQFKLTGTKKAYEAHEAVDLEFLIKDSISGKPIETSFSLAVTDNDYPHDAYSAGNALTSLLLSSEIHGFVENPEYYFEDNDIKRTYNLDLLLRIQGWRRYSWQEMAGINPFLKLYELERSFMLEGDVFNVSKREAPSVPKVGVEAHLFIDTLDIGGIDTTDSKGHFRFDIGEFMGEAIVTVTADGEGPKGKRKYRKDYDQKYLIPLYRVNLRIPKQYSFYEKNMLPNSKSFGDIIDSLYGGANKEGIFELEEAKIKKKRREASTYYLTRTTPLFRLDVQEEIDKGIDLGVNWVQEGNWFFPTLHALKLRGKIKPYYKYYRDTTYTKEEIRIRYNTARLKTIEIYANTNQRDRYINALNSDWSKDIYINMNPHTDLNFHYPEVPGRRTKYQGYSYVSEFYSPDYSQMTPPENSDRRRTLYWNPSVKTDSTGRASVRFYNSSTCRYMKISAETVTSDGKPIVLQR